MSDPKAKAPWGEIPDVWRKRLVEHLRAEARPGRILSEEPAEDLGPHCRAQIHWSRTLEAAADELEQ